MAQSGGAQQLGACAVALMAPDTVLPHAAASSSVSLATVQAAAPLPASRRISSLAQVASAAEPAVEEQEGEQRERATSHRQQQQQQEWQQQQPPARPPAADVEPGGKGVGGSPPCVRALPRHCWQCGARLGEGDRFFCHSCDSIQPADPASEYFEVFGL